MPKYQPDPEEEEDVTFENFREWVKTTDDPMTKHLVALMQVKKDKEEDENE